MPVTGWSDEQPVLRLQSKGSPQFSAAALASKSSGDLAGWVQALISIIVNVIKSFERSLT